MLEVVRKVSMDYDRDSESIDLAICWDKQDGGSGVSERRWVGE